MEITPTNRDRNDWPGITSSRLQSIHFNTTPKGVVLKTLPKPSQMPMLVHGLGQEAGKKYQALKSDRCLLLSSTRRERFPLGGRKFSRVNNKIRQARQAQSCSKQSFVKQERYAAWHNIFSLTYFDSCVSFTLSKRWTRIIQQKR